MGIEMKVERVLLAFSLGHAKLLLAALTVSMLSGCASFYVDTATRDIPADQMVKVPNPKSVQFQFEFQTKGAPNARATEHLKPQVTTLTTSSGLFSEVSAVSVSSGATLSITVNNVPLTDNAFGKGLVTGLTFGLAGNTVTDGYICTLVYLPGNNAPSISKTVRHAIHTTLGAQSAPANAEKSESLQDAVTKMVRQIITNALNELGRDPDFQK
jgi:hypothetical protein